MRIFPEVPPLLLPGEGLSQWMAKRQALKTAFARIEYGCRPDMAYSVEGELLSEERYPDEDTLRRIVKVTVRTELGSHSFPLYVFLPRGKQAVPTTLLICSRSKVLKPLQLPEGLELSALPAMFQRMGVVMDGPLDLGGERRALDLAEDTEDGHWPVKAVLRRGHAVAGFYATDAQPDSADFACALAKIFGTANDRKQDEWGILSIWAFAAQCALEVLLTMEEPDPERIGITGHSRCGKAALWAAVQEERFAWVMPNNSGCCGAALLRGKHGENMVSINAMMPYWFAPTFKSYVGREQELPFDQHMLLALVAPRKLYVTSGSEDYWADPAGEHRSTVLANQVFRLYGSPAMPEAFPEENSPVHAGAQGYHLRTGPHLLTEYDWMGLLDHIDGIPGSTH